MNHAWILNKMDVFQGIIGSCITVVAGLLGYLHKRNTARMDKIENGLDRHRRDIDMKLTRFEVKEIVDDKLAPIIVTLLDIKKDCEEIGKDVKAMRHHR